MLVASAAVADDREAAQTAFARGQESFERKEFRNAALSFERAAELVESGAAHFNAGRSWEAAGDRPRAVVAYDRALANPKLLPQQREEAGRRAGRLRRELGVLRVRGRGRVSVAHLHNVAVPLDVYVEPGSHIIIVHDPVGTRRVAASVERRGVVDVRTDAPTQPRPRQQAAPVVPPDKSSRAAGGTTQPYGWAAYGLGAVAAGASVYLGVNALDARDQFEASGRRDVDAHDRAASLRTWSNVAAGSAAALAILGTYLVFIASDADSTQGRQPRRPARLSF
jgi:tetratricopeptide (TPR) repeat protein